MPPSELPNVRFRRVYIPKSGPVPVAGDARPLGVPDLFWRVFGRGLNNMLVYFYGRHLVGQHAYQVGKGVRTAWGEVWSLLEKSPYVTDFDLKGFFDGVSHSCVRRKLLEYGVPSSQVEFVMHLCRNVPSMGAPSGDLLEEPDRLVRLLADGSPNPGFVDGPGAVDHKVRGVPQGMPFSCGLSILCNIDKFVYHEFVAPDGSPGWMLVVRYADDGMAFSSHPIDLNSLVSEADGVALSPGKGGVIRLSGTASVSFRFLGLRWSQGRLSAATRSGSILPLDDERLAWFCARQYWDSVVETGSQYLSRWIREFAGGSVRDLPGLVELVDGDLCGSPEAVVMRRTLSLERVVDA